MDASRGAAAAATWIFCGDKSRASGTATEDQIYAVPCLSELKGCKIPGQPCDPDAALPKPEPVCTPCVACSTGGHTDGENFGDREHPITCLKEYDATICDNVSVRRADISPVNRGGAAAAAWIFQGDESRRRRGCHVDISWRRVAATPRRSDARGQKRHCMGPALDGAAAATWIFHGVESRRRRGCDIDIPPTGRSGSDGSRRLRRVAAAPTGRGGSDGSRRLRRG